MNVDCLVMIYATAGMTVQLHVIKTVPPLLQCVLFFCFQVFDPTDLPSDTGNRTISPCSLSWGWMKAKDRRGQSRLDPS